MKCKLCNKDTERLVKSHVIAQSIHALSTREEDPTTAVLLSNDPRLYPQKSRTGVYDRLVCLSCEAIFQPWEDHALEFFRKAYSLAIPTKRTHLELKGYDHDKLKLFFISVLWKADVSNHKVYQHVKVGEKHRNKLVDLLIGKNSGGWQDYSIFMERFNSSRPAASIMRSPGKARMERKIKFYVFYMAGFKIYIKCDSRKVPEKYRDVFLVEGHTPVPPRPYGGECLAVALKPLTVGILKSQAQ